MLEIIPAIDLRGGCCVRLRQGDYAQETVFGDDPAAMAQRWEQAGGQRLHLVDLDGAKAGRPVNLKAIRNILAAVAVPCQLGGGVRSEETIRELLALGIERVIIGTQAIKQPDWFQAMARKFPRQVCLGLDARNSMAAAHGWLEDSHVPALDLARRFADLPLGALIYTNIANDGMLRGIDPGTLDDLTRLADLKFNVIASGGLTTLDDVRRLRDIARRHPGLTGAIAGRAIYEGVLDLAEAVAAAKDQG